MTAVDLFRHWELPPSIWAGCVILLAAYLWARRFKFDLKTLSFSSGVLIIFLALCSPLDALADGYLFSAHMLQHMLLGTIAPPLLIAGIPASFVESWLRFRIVAWLERILSQPVLALFVGCGTFWVWHLPGPYTYALENETVHTIEHLLFIVSGTMLWWPVLKPVPEGKLAPMGALIYLGLVSFIGMILGIIFTVSDTVFYSYYNHPEDELGLLKLIRDDWGVTALDDQKLGGGMMWEPMGAVFLCAMMSALVSWYKRSEHELLHQHERRSKRVSEK